MDANIHPIKVAMVEDDVVFLRQWSEILDAAPGYSCVGSFPGYREAAAGLPSVHADVALIDLRLSPTQTGIDLIRKMRVYCPATKFMIFTVFEEEEHIFDALRAGAKSYFLKNTSSVKILESIRELREGGAPMSAPIARRICDFFSEAEAPASFSLTSKEKEILGLLASGSYYKEIARNLFISEGTLKQYIHTIYEKLEVNNSREAINKYFGKPNLKFFFRT